METLEQGVKYVKVNNKDTKTTPSFLLLTLKCNYRLGISIEYFKKCHEMTFKD